MDASQAFFLLELSPGATSEELETSFRRLVMKYHPDRNADRLEWSHRMTVLLMEAHETASRRIAEEAYERAAAAEKRRLAADLRFFAEAFDAARGGVLEALYTYYAYGLENIPLRSEGNLRLRFTTAKNTLRKGLGIFASLESRPAPPDLKTRAALYQAFGGAFQQNMNISRILVPDGSEDHKAYRHYRNGSLILDSLIKKRFFPKDFTVTDLGPKSASLCEQELFLVITDYRLSVWMPEAVIKLSLLDGFSRLIKYEADMA